MDIPKKDPEAQERLEQNNQKIELLSEINEVLQKRQEVVQNHNILLKRWSDLQNQIQSLWEERLTAAKERGTNMEAKVMVLRRQLAEAQQQRGNTGPIKIPEPAVEAPKSASKDFPSRKANLKITASRLQGEIKGFQQRINTTKLRLLNEIKNKNQVEMEVRQFRTSLSRKRSNAPSTVSTPLPGHSPVDPFA